MQHVFSVQELTQAVKGVVEGQFPLVWVRGQVSNLSRPGSGHIYFTLKDELAQLKVVWFKGNQWQTPALESLHNGQEIVCAGRLSVYPPQGTYQLIAEWVQDQGIGRLQAAFEALKQKMEAKGYFAQDRKRPLPPHPQRVAVVTAPQGAAVRDFLRLAGERGRPAAIRIYPSLMQGEGAEDNVIGALEQVQLDEWAEVVVITRGGGSLEDLWTFNTEAVAEAVAHFPLPTVAAIGHERDVTIVDLIADSRAATPSHAAQLVWPLRQELVQEVDEWEMRLDKAWMVQWRHAQRRFAELEKGLGWLSPRRRLQRMDKECHRLGHALVRTGRRFVTQQESRAHDSSEALLHRVRRHFGRTATERLEHAGRRLLHCRSNHFNAVAHRLEIQTSALAHLDPKAPLRHGFSLVSRVDTGELVTSAAQVAPEDFLQVQTGDGAYRVRATAGDTAASSGQETET
ncbi:exodeoxyribonuclease VII large subunit [Desulfohalobium retbaense]|uniref:Exodeoxyribonuclease 7 large subunit n=1 Tax=Desulfohalobium retbaense (strain ATCC 49708 / DSM 5692 / JCM 16813 / HR100) TaxID=485915 RepID=C8X3P8_DESRD|nr:exodeoxyribonuclease VII large subunit [Desulfohalobium retbaense]ACV69045.1 exodeoxyribonuclease VII, large subunit [Desulfohalobium retbaense DSM 5692]